MNTRKQQARQILKTPNTIAQVDTGKFKVKSMSVPDKYYMVSRTGNGLVCECLDNQFRRSDCKHIQVIKSIIMQNRGYANSEFKIMERSMLNLCKYCDSGNIKKDGFRNNKKGKCRYFNA